MKQILCNAKSTVGFTLIELLVVIGILGILAAALIATIDPFEQLKKANDANVENTEIELINAVIRYYTIHNGFPWDATDDGGTNCFSINAGGVGAVPADLPEVVIGDDTFELCLQDLVDNGELKTSFMDAEGILNEISVFEASTRVTACYDPESKAKTNDAQTKYLLVADAVTGTEDTTECVGTSDPTDDGSGGFTGGDNEDCFRCTSG